jgi:hypothetical protein
MLPALLAHHRRLEDLRYDYPLVLLADAQRDEPCVLPLSALVDEAIAGFLHGEGGDRFAQFALLLEREIRVQLARGVRETLPVFVRRVANDFAAHGEAEAWTLVAEALTQEGELVDCDADAPAAIVRHTWSAFEAAKAQRYSKASARLVARLEEILRADVAHSAAGRTAQHLESGFGPAHGGDFDFGAMSGFLLKAAPTHAVSDARRRRIEATLNILKSQKFFATGRPGAKPYRFVFEDCASALSAYAAREAKALELAKAIAIAELEADGNYKESLHDALFAEFKAEHVQKADLRIFPDYLVCVNLAKLHGEEHETLSQILAAGLPVKVLVQTDDLLEEPARGGDSHLTIGWRSRQVASSAMDLHGVYVVQTTSSDLYRRRDALLAGMSFDGPALFSVYSGAGGKAAEVPTYLEAAMALESRAFPSFTYDPMAGESRHERLKLDGNPQPGVDWPVHVFQYEKPDFQRVQEQLPFTVLEFLACDARYAAHFSAQPAARWNEQAIPAAEAIGAGAVEGAAAYVLAVDEAVLQVARRCREAWHALQEAAGIGGGVVATAAVEAGKVETVDAAPAPVVAPAAASNTDEPFIETERCATCNECTAINGEMFKYNKDKQAYIANPDAGTYRQLV